MRILYNHLARASFGTKFLIFIGIELLFFCLTSLVTIALSLTVSGITLTRIALTIQDLLLFIITKMFNIQLLIVCKIPASRPCASCRSHRRHRTLPVFCHSGHELHHRVERINNFPVVALGP